MAIFRIRPGLRKRDPNPTSRRSLAVRCGARWRGRCKTSSCGLSRRCSAITARTPPGPHSVAVMKRIGNSRRTGSSPADAIRHWSAEGGHPIEDLTAENGLTPLPSWTSGAKTIADDGLVAEERILHPALTMVP